MSQVPPPKCGLVVRCSWFVRLPLRGDARLDQEIDQPPRLHRHVLACGVHSKDTQLYGSVVRHQFYQRPALEVGPDQELGLQNDPRTEEHKSELQSLMRISYAVFCLKKKSTSTSNTRQKRDR